MLRRIQLSNKGAERVVLVAKATLFAGRPTAARAPAPTASSSSSPSPSAAPVPAMVVARRCFYNPFRSSREKVSVDPVSFDKENMRYRGKIFGLPADDVVFYSKVIAGAVAVVLVCYVFLKGYALLTRFSLQTVARLGFIGGFVTCMILYTTAVQLVRRASINANAVYNQSIALAMRHERVQQLLGSRPRTGEFKAYSATGGFKLPLLRRIRSGSYELSDLLGLKPRRLQMLFVLKNPSTGHEGIVSCDVRKETTGFMSSTNVYKSLAITIRDRAGGKAEPETIILIGKPSDVVSSMLLK